MEQSVAEKKTHLFFLLSVILKGINAATEIVGGVVIFFISHEYIARLVLSATQDELSEDPKDFIAHFLIKSASNLSLSTQYFFSFYLLAHGIIKIVMVVGLLKKQRWAFPTSLTVFTFFIFYQVYRFIFTHSFWLLLLTVFDVIVIWLIWREYKYQKAKVIAIV